MSRGSHGESLAGRLALAPAPGRHRAARPRVPRWVLVAAIAVAAGGAITLGALVSSAPPPAAARTAVHALRKPAVLPQVSPEAGTDPVLTPPPSRPSPAAAAAPRTYTVRSGESAWSIAYHQCGNGNDWRALARANPSVNIWKLLIGESIDLTC